MGTPTLSDAKTGEKLCLFGKPRQPCPTDNSADKQHEAKPLTNARIAPWGASILFLLLAGAPGIGQSLLRGAARPASPWTPGPFSRVGLEAHAGLGGAGFNVATPLSRSFNLRAGADFFGYSTNFQEQGAEVFAKLLLRSGHTSLDWFPLSGRLRLSPLVVFANNNRATATALVPSGSTITLNGQDYISSTSDPLHGSGSISFRKTSPGLSLGTGNLIPRRASHFSMPLEAGFYYVGQPALFAGFSGSACNPTLLQSVACSPVDRDAGFQENLNAFIARNQHNLSYASFFPIFSAGFGYAF